MLAPTPGGLARGATMATHFDAARDRVLAAVPALEVSAEGGAVAIRQPALMFSATMAPAEARALAAALGRAADRAERGTQLAVTGGGDG